MLYKYLISIVVFTVFIQATPKLFEFYGKKMEAFNDNCKVYKKDKRIPNNIKKKCKIYVSKVNKVFKYGYKLDTSVKRDNINLDKAEKYNILLHDLEEKKDIIIHLINLEIRKAIKKSDIKYFKFLLSSLYVEIKPYEYDFMEKFKDSFNKYPKYIEHKEKLVLKREEDIKQRQSLIAEEKKRREDIKSKKEKKTIKKEDDYLKYSDYGTINSCDDWIAYIQKKLTKINYNLDNGKISMARILYELMHDAEIKAIAICDTESADKLKKYHQRTIKAIKVLDNKVIPKIKTTSYISDPEPKYTTQLPQVDTLAKKRAKVLTDKHLSNLTIDFGIISCWERNTRGYSSKYIVIDHAGTVYAVNGKARGHAKKAGWIDAKTILKPNGDYGVFSDIIGIAMENGCTSYYGL